MTDGRKITVTMTAHQAGALIAAANLVANKPNLQGTGWDGTQLRTLRVARSKFEDAAIIAFELGDVARREAARKRAQA